ncbi:nuclease homologue [Pseudomonas guineae]|uniref:Nuclease homologue n=2 Tax=Pseudomonas guineae TaxID=425504 RepID=A0A1I3ERT3_9PSED|nr:thermonuclease family protein [Pseudomonas guineae]SFI01684.1 nuclease homologue [Pseudomonas guineae]
MAGFAVLKKASLVGAFFVFGFYFDVALAFCPAPGPMPSVQVQRVVDGDTLRLVDGRNVRLIGLNSPEVGRQGRPPEPFAEAARKRLQVLLAASGGRVALQFGQQAKDHYGRTLAHAYDSLGRNLETQLLGEGLAYRVAVAPNLALVQCQLAAERSARQARLGLWQRSPVKTPAQLKQGGFALLEGRINRIERNGGGMWLEMGDGLVLHIARRALGDFDLRAVQRLEGRKVEARGWVIDRSTRGSLGKGQARWMLPLTDKTMLEVLP